MKWIKGKWAQTEYEVYVDPEDITAVDFNRSYLWVEDCDNAVQFSEEDLPALLKLVGHTAEEVGIKLPEEKKNDKKVRKETDSN